MNTSSRRWRALKYGLPFGVFIGAGFAYLNFASKTRYDVKRDRDSDIQLDYLVSALKVAAAPTPEEVYKADIEGKSFDDWQNIRGPHIGEDNSDFEQILAAQKRSNEATLQQLKQLRREAYRKAYEQRQLKNKQEEQPEVSS